MDDAGIIQKMEVLGGCSGNLQGISALVVGMPAQEAIHRLKGIRCGAKSTSCPDQFACGLESALAKQKQERQALRHLPRACCSESVQRSRRRRNSLDKR